jgi:hypothetical protein
VYDKNLLIQLHDRYYILLHNYMILNNNKTKLFQNSNKYLIYQGSQIFGNDEGRLGL